MTPAERAELAALRQARDGGMPFVDFVAKYSPELGKTVPRHLQPLYQLAEESRRRAVFATVSMPPRFGKSTTARNMVAWRMLRDPACLHFYVTYGDGLATDFSYKTRKLARLAGVPMASDRANVHDWATELGGGLKSTSVGGDITGRGSQSGLIIPDDLIKNRAEAESLTVRNRAWSCVLDDVSTRRDDHMVSMIFPGTRWHVDDVIGRIFKDNLGEKWDHIKLAAVVDRNGEPVDGGKRGELFDPDLHIPLWPEAGKNLEWARKERAKGAYRWWSLFQQEPRSHEGKIFECDPARFNLDAFSLDDGWRLAMVLDPAATAKTSSDFSAVVVVAMRGYGEQCEGRALGLVHAQEKLPSILRKIRKLRERFPIPLHIEGVGGFAMMPDAIHMVDPELPTILIPSRSLRGGKMERSAGYAEAWNSGRFAVPLGEEWDGFIEEHREFTGIDDAHDDQVDAAAHGWNICWRGEPDEIYAPTLTRGQAVGA